MLYVTWSGSAEQLILYHLNLKSLLWSTMLNRETWLPVCGVDLYQVHFFPGSRGQALFLRRNIPCLHFFCRIITFACLFPTFFPPLVSDKKGPQVALTRTNFAVAGFWISHAVFHLQLHFWEKYFSIVFLGFYSSHLQCTAGFTGDEEQSFNLSTAGSSDSFLSRMWFIHIWIIQVSCEREQKYSSGAHVHISVVPA